MKQNQKEIETLKQKIAQKAEAISKIEEEHKVLLNLDQKINMSVVQENEKNKLLTAEYQEA
jgi:hypothetical protein